MDDHHDISVFSDMSTIITVLSDAWIPGADRTPNLRAEIQHDLDTFGIG